MSRPHGCLGLWARYLATVVPAGVVLGVVIGHAGYALETALTFRRRRT